MKIVQTLWTMPMLRGQGDIYENRFHGGWMNVKYYLMSLAYSCLQLKKFYDELSLVTDETGNEILINKLGLPYTEVHVTLDQLNHYDPQLWALGKIYAYSIQKEPFLHVDGDVYIWEPFHKKLEKAALVAQNLEQNFQYYRSAMTELIEQDCYIPPVVTKINRLENKINAYNAGVFGGTNIGFFQSYVAEIKLFLTKNKLKLPSLQIGKLNAIFEQHLFYCMSKEWQLKVNCVTNVVNQDKLYYMLTDLSQFVKAPDKVKFMHLFGGESKNNPGICKHLEGLLKSNYPEYHQRILDICDSGFLNTLTADKSLRVGAAALKSA
jgi:hypothetical protein